MNRSIHRPSMGLVLATVAVALAGAAVTAQAQTAAPMIYPAKGQTEAQKDRDKYACHDWAKAQSGFDPMQPATPATPSTSGNGSVSASGMAKGAMGGAAIAELTDHSAGKGAAAGVVGAAVFDRARQQQAAQARQQQAAQQQAARSQLQATYGRAFGACMEARGYVVK